MKRLNLLLTILVMLLALAVPAPASGPGPGVTPDAVLTMLKTGNTRFLSGNPQHPHQDLARRSMTALQGQQPMASVLACSDSRAPVELIFDQGVGDLFIVRVAGNVAGQDEIASLEYGTEHLGTPVLVVLGHTKCGAVTAVVENAHLHGSLPALAARIRPAVAKTRAAHRDLKGDPLVAAAIKANIQQAMTDLLAKSQIIRDLVKNGKLQISGALYDLESGRVEWLGPLPAQK